MKIPRGGRVDFYSFFLDVFCFFLDVFCFFLGGIGAQYTSPSDNRLDEKRGGSFDWQISVHKIAWILYSKMCTFSSHKLKRAESSVRVCASSVVFLSELVSVTFV